MRLEDYYPTGEDVDRIRALADLPVADAAALARMTLYLQQAINTLDDLICRAFEEMRGPQPDDV